VYTRLTSFWGRTAGTAMKTNNRKKLLKRNRVEFLQEISNVIISLLKERVDGPALDVARVAIDLSDNKNVIVVSPNGISVGDRVKSSTSIMRKNTIPKSTPGNVIGYDLETKKYLVLFFPVWYPHGVLALVGEKEINFIMKPRVEEPIEPVFTDPDKTPDAPRSAVVKLFSDEVLARNGLAVSGEWLTSRELGEDGSTIWNLRAVIQKSGLKIPRGNPRIARKIIRSTLLPLQVAAFEIKSSGVENFVEIVKTSAWEAPLSGHKDLESYAALEITYRI
jgi:hypothetical protein